VNRISTAAGLLDTAGPSPVNRHHVRKLPEYPAEEIRPLSRAAALGVMPPVNGAAVVAADSSLLSLLCC